MAYATPQNMIDRYDAKEIAERSYASDSSTVDVDLFRAAVAGESLGAWTEDEQAEAAYAVGRVETVLDDVSAVMDDYLRKVYTIPLTSPPASLRIYCCQLARRKLHDDAPPEEATAAYDEAMQAMENIAKGIIVLDIDGSGGTAATGGVTYTATERVFTRATILGA